MDNGFFATFRQSHKEIKDHCKRTSGITIAVFQELCFRARYQDGNDLKVGQCYLGQRELADELDFGVQSVKSALNSLVELTHIQLTTSPRGTLVTILDSTIFNACGKETKSQLTDNQPLTYNNNNKNNTSSPKKPKKIVVKERKPWEVRAVNQEEVRVFCTTLQDNLESIRNPVHHGIATLYLRTFATLEEAEHDIGRIFQASLTASPSDVDGQVRFINACIGKHLKQMEAAYGV